MTGRAELIGKLEAMRTEVRALGDNPATALRTIGQSLDALTFVVIGMLEAQSPPQCEVIQAGRRCVQTIGHMTWHHDAEGLGWP